MLELWVLGRFELRLDAAAVVVPSRPAQSLLAYLALSAGTAHRREKLAGLLWPEADEDNARSNLRHALWRIRKAIEPDRSAAPYLLSDELAVAFNAGADYWLDAAMLTRDGGTLPEQLAAAAVYRGELLPGFYDEWVTLERERLEAVFQHRMDQVLHRLVEERRWPAVLEWAERWIALGHAPEPAYRALMLAHAELGDRARVAAVYQRCRAALFEELGVEPSALTRRLFERLCQDATEPSGAVGASGGAAVTVDDAPAPGAPPYQGLTAFDEQDADRFFGRERLTTRLVTRLRTEPFLAVIGASGSGKSSVVRAGLVPALKGNGLGGVANGNAATRLDGLGTAVRVLTPTAHPIDALATALAPGAGGRQLLLEELGRDRHGLRRFVEREFPRSAGGQVRRVVLIIDQFEELFTLCHDTFEREAFADNLLGATESDDLVSVVIALRADFYAHCAQFAGLREAIAAHQEYVGPLGAAELHRVIEAPAEQGGWELEPGLVGLLLRDVGEEPGNLPLLSHALLETWRRRRGRGLSLAGYAAAGGVQGAIAQTAETVFADQLSPEQQAVSRRLFLSLTELGDGTQDTRRRTSLDELVRNPAEEPDVRVVLRVLAEARLVTLGHDTVEVAHEALIREWPRLREWLGQNRDNLRIQRQLVVAAREWDRLGADAGSLYRGTRLTQALEWAAEHQDELGRREATFLAASQQAADRETAEREAQRQRDLEAAQRIAEAERQRAEDQSRAASQLRLRAVMLGLTLGAAVLLGGAALILGDSARHEAARAESNARAAVSRELAAAALTNLSVDPERAALLALQATDTTYTVDRTWTAEAEDALHRVAPLLRTQLTLAGIAGQVSSVAFSPDGATLATGNQDGTAKLWNALTGQEQATLRGHAAGVNAVAFSPDGSLVATASDDHTARVWDVPTGLQRLALLGHTREVERLVFSPDGTRLATTSLDGSVRLWDIGSGLAALVFRPGRPGEVAAALDVAFSPDGHRLATAVPEGEIDAWDLEPSAEQPRLLRSWQTSQYGASGTGPAVAFSPDGTRVSATTGTGAQLWWTETGQPALSIVGHTLQITAGAFSPDGTRFATAGMDGTAKVWDAQSGRELLSLAGHQAAIQAAVFSPDSRRLATASQDGTARIWDLRPAHEALTIANRGTLGTNSRPRPEAPQAGQVAISWDGKQLMAGLEDGTARVWEGGTGRELLALRGHEGRVWGAAISVDGGRLATGGDDRTVRVWDGRNGDPLWTGSAHADAVAAVTFSPDGTRLASASADGTARLWDAGTGQEISILTGHTGPLTGLAFSPDGLRLATSSQGSDDPIRLWETRTGGLLGTLAGHQDVVWSIAFSPDGARLVSASRDGTARIWDAGNGQPTSILHGHGTLVSASFSPDGQRVVTGSRDGRAEIWDATSGQQLLELGGTEVGEGVDSLTFSSDGRFLVVRGDQAARLYVLPIEDLAALVRSRLTRGWTPDECHRFLHLEQCPGTPAQSARELPQAVAAGPTVALIRSPGVPVPVVAPASGLTGTLKIVSSLPHLGNAKAQIDSMINAFSMALDDHRSTIGQASLTYVDMDDTTFAGSGAGDAPTETANANKAANDPDVMLYLGPYTSGAARQAIPILCQAGLGVISPSNTYPGLTRQTPYNASGEPDVYYRGCQRNYARVVPADDVQGAVGAGFAKQLGATRVYVLHDSEAYGQGVAAVFAATAENLGMRVVGGPEGMDPASDDYRALALKVRQSGADLVYWGGITDRNAGKLWQDLRSMLGAEVALMGPDGINEEAFVRAAGAAAEGTYATFPGLPPSLLVGKGAEWYRRYKQQFQAEPEPYAAYGYEAMTVALGAIERAGQKDRAAIREALLSTRDFEGVLGTWSFTPTGDTTLARMSVRQVRNGRWDDSTAELVEARP